MQRSVHRCNEVEFVAFLCCAEYDRGLFFEEGCLDKNASIIRKVPLFYKRPNLTEMNRVYLQLATVTLSPLDLSPSEPIPMDVAAISEPKQEIVSVPSVNESTTEKKEEVVDNFNPLILEDACMESWARSDKIDVNFWKAISESDTATVRMILLERPHYNYLWWKQRNRLMCRNEDGETPLHVATLSGNCEMVSFFVHAYE